MNHLAHFYLATLDTRIPLADSLAGAFLGDFVKGRLGDDYPENIRTGIQLHRKIDAYTDRHHVVRQAVRRFASPYRRFAPVIIDLVFDHLLAKDWDTYHPQSLMEFSHQVYSQVESRKHHLPEKAETLIQVMKNRQSLLGYADTRFLDRSLEYLSVRMKNADCLANSHSLIVSLLAEIEEDFRLFFPDARNAVLDIVNADDD